MYTSKQGPFNLEGKVIKITSYYSSGENKSADDLILNGRYMYILSVEKNHFILLPMSSFISERAQINKYNKLAYEYNVKYGKAEGNVSDAYITCNKAYKLSFEDYNNTECFTFNTILNKDDVIFNKVLQCYEEAKRKSDISFNKFTLIKKSEIEQFSYLALDKQNSLITVWNNKIDLRTLDNQIIKRNSNFINIGIKKSNFIFNKVEDKRSIKNFAKKFPLVVENQFMGYADFESSYKVSEENIDSFFIQTYRMTYTNSKDLHNKKNSLAMRHKNVSDKESKELVPYENKKEITRQEENISEELELLLV